MAAATDRLLATVDRLDDQALREPSLLPGWTRGHVLTHLARNADGLVEPGAVGPRPARPARCTPAGTAGREAEIEAGADRHIGDVRLDLADSAERLLAAFADGFPAGGAGRGRSRCCGGATAYGWEIPLMRIREVEIHHVDLDAGYTPDDWSAEFAARTLDQLAPFFREARDCPVGVLVATDADGRWEVAADGPVLDGLGRPDAG